MKAISLKEPWASMIMRGEKTIETRKWATSYRGDILICASQKPKTENSGYALCIATIVDVKPMTKEDEKGACANVYPRANSWYLKNIRKIKKFPVKGSLGIYEVEMKR
jgi:hypothetical protein